MSDRQERLMQLPIAGGMAAQISLIERERWGRTRIYIWDERESVIDNMRNRRSRPIGTYRQITIAALSQLAPSRGLTVAWNQKAGCSCGCSPGFVVRQVPSELAKQLRGRDVHITVGVKERKLLTARSSVRLLPPVRTIN